MENDKKITLSEKFWEPVNELLPQSETSRDCSKYSDTDHLMSGISRVISDEISGRAWIQNCCEYLIGIIFGVGNFFDALKSERRLKFLSEMVTLLSDKIDHYALNNTDINIFSQHPELKSFRLFATDGHSHGASCHDERIAEKKRATNHIFSLNLFTHTLHYIDLCVPEEGKKKEHEIKTLKRQSIQKLRMGSPKGIKTIHAYDPAVIDYQYWHKCKENGVYFITLEKSNSALIKCGDFPVDRTDERNKGVISDERVVPCNGHAMRRICYYDSVSGKMFSFLTTEMTLPPGLIAFIYKCRWDIEKVFDETKNKFQENKAWAKSQTAKKQQALFICMAYNLIHLLSLKMDKEEGIQDEKNIIKREKRRIAQIQQAKERNQEVNPLVLNLSRGTQHCLQFIRWLRLCLKKKTSLTESVISLRPLMLEYLK